MTKLDDALAGVTKLGLDTSPVTNDTALQRISELRVLVLDELEL